MATHKQRTQIAVQCERCKLLSGWADTETQANKVAIRNGFQEKLEEGGQLCPWCLRDLGFLSHEQALEADVVAEEFWKEAEEEKWTR